MVWRRHAVIVIAAVWLIGPFILGRFAPSGPERPVYRCVVNTSSGVIHTPTCGHLRKVKDREILHRYPTVQQAVDAGFTPCRHCLAGAVTTAPASGKVEPTQ